MNTHLFKYFLQVKNRFCFRSIIVCYALGVLLGSIFSVLFLGGVSGDVILQLLSSSSFISLFFINLFPVTLIFLLVYFSWRIFCYPVLFMRAFLTGFTGMMIYLSAEGCGWLIRPFLMFSTSVISFFVLLLLWHKTNGIQKRDLLISFLIVLGITLFDRFLISDFLASLIIYF